MPSLDPNAVFAGRYRVVRCIATGIKVLASGGARFVAEPGTQGATRSRGTPLSTSPEQFRGMAVSPASDIFALSLVAYTLMVGEPYWAPEATGDVDLIAFALKTVT